MSEDVDISEEILSQAGAKRTVTIHTGTPVVKLKGLEFYVYLYALEQPRRYKDERGQPVEGENTIGVGYVGKDECIEEGTGRIQETVQAWKGEFPRLRRQYGADFPNMAQYEFLRRLDADKEITAGEYLMGRAEAEQWIRANLLGRQS
ncbi:MAG: hypothetical protein HYW25_00215 [Candidatus Aenigmarchaeota archaeon]|nr:hypothetical protein [Candidatus Aenigmarchaeota archaeon]